MNNPQENKLSMYEAVSAVCKKHASVWQGHVAFARHAAEFEGHITALRSWREVQRSSRDGVVLNKERLQNLLIDAALPLAGALCAYGQAAQDGTVLVLSDLERSDFATLRDEQIDDLAMSLHDKAAELLAAQADLPANAAAAKLRDYGATTAMLAAVSAAATAYGEVVHAPRLATGEVRTATVTIQEHFAQGDSVLDLQLDKLVRQFKAAHPDFVAQYRSARIIVQTAASRAANGGEAVTPPPAATPALAGAGAR